MPEHRPYAHLRPERGWTNDPTGPVRWQSRTHLFHQYNPQGGYWDRPHWGHLVSDDLVRWQRRPVALSPTPGGPDAAGCYSGCVVIDGDAAVMAYTGVVGPPVPGQLQVTCLARSTDPLLDRWVKDPTNPVTTAPPGRQLLGFRDPFLWQDDRRWWQAIGAGSREEGGEVLLYSSTDLHRWVPHGALLTKADLDAVDPQVWTGSMWECPVLLRGRDGDALLLSIHDEVDTHYPLAVVGQLVADRFVPSRLQRLDLGPDLYAPCLLQEADGTAISWAWSWEARTPAAQRASGWAGVLSAPRRLEVVDGHLRVAPLAQLTQLRERALDVRPTPTARGWVAAGIDTDVADLELTLGPAVERIDLKLRCSPGREEVTTLTLDRSRGEVWLDREHASLDPAVRGGRYGGPLDPALPIQHVRVLLDRSIVEVFVDHRVALTARIYPTREDSTGVEVVGAPDSLADIRLRAWSLTSIWAEGEQPEQHDGRPSGHG
ncbi:MAG: glycoside hydrolase family 32 protein [Nitriliruptor sp.]|nr:MAG: glycoside hydrolase family 32 protein [Nitriliruptor sp.]